MFMSFNSQTFSNKLDFYFVKLHERICGDSDVHRIFFFFFYFFLIVVTNAS